MKTIDYDEIACSYNERYKSAYKPEGIASKLLELAQEVNALRILEVACGTGHWLEILQAKSKVYGIDLSFGMLKKAIERKGRLFLINGDVSSLPISNRCFDIVFCVNSLHHFRNPSGFILDAQKLLGRDGVLAIFGMNPHADRDRWFIYDYFPETYEADLGRYPSPGTIVDWMISAGFKNVNWQVGERLVDHREGNDVLPISKNFTSQLTLLSSAEYRRGINRIKSALREAKAVGETLTFPVDITLSMITGRV